VTCPIEQPSNSPLGEPARLRAGVVYQASLFPIPIRLALPDGSWSGGQWKTGSTGCRIGQYGIGQNPFYGWVAVGHGSDPEHRSGSIVIVTSYGTTPSVASVVALMLKTGRGVSYQQPEQTKVAGLAGRRLDGHVEAARHQFFAFTKPGEAAGSNHDGVDMAQGVRFRILVLDGHGKTIVVYITSGSLPASDFLAFLTKANTVLRSLSFPKGG
jgi:hypothetical protein